MAGYNATFAEFYDRLTDDVDYGRMAEFCMEKLAEHHPKCELILDLACGTGSLAAQFAAQGQEVIAVDSSPEMLMQGMNKNTGFRVPILFLMQRMEELNLYGTVDLAVSALDSVNHLEGARAVEEAFSRLKFFIEPGGLFIFDVNTPYKHREVLGMSTYVREAEDVYCVWQNEYQEGPEHRVEITMDLFAEQENGSYLRTSECFSEYAYPLETLERLLRENEFTLLSAHAGYTEAPAGERDERWVLVARRD